MNAARASFVLVSTATLIIGCGEDSEGPSGGAATCAQISKLCEKWQSCAPFFLKGVFGDVATCTARSQLSCENEMAAAGTGLTAQTLGACLNALSSGTCEAFLDESPTACQFKGTLATGTVCATSSQCQSGFCRVDQGACGTCAAVAAAGASCNVDECDYGLVCNESDQCVKPSAAGASCDGDRPCRSSLFCNNGTCAAPGAAGQACDPDEDSCNFFHGLVCNQNTRVCETVRYANAGEPCGLVQTQLTVCSSGGSCRQTSETAGVCQAAAKDGETCGATANDRDCLAPAECVSGTCRVPSSASCK